MLTDEQNVAVENAANSVIQREKLFRIGGYAGTGKTTVARSIVDRIGGALVCAFTGKATCRLQEKGLPEARTIHSTIYNYNKVTKEFFLKPEIDGNYFLVDEGSMISLQLWEDLNSFNLPVVVLGDPGQLEPIGNDPNLMHLPNVVLQKIHRQEELSGIMRPAATYA